MSWRTSIAYICDYVMNPLLHRLSSLSELPKLSYCILLETISKLAFIPGVDGTNKKNIWSD